MLLSLAKNQCHQRLSHKKSDPKVDTWICHFSCWQWRHTSCQSSSELNCKKFATSAQYDCQDRYVSKIFQHFCSHQRPTLASSCGQEQVQDLCINMKSCTWQCPLQYINELLIPYSPSKSLRSADSNLLAVPRCQLWWKGFYCGST